MVEQGVFPKTQDILEPGFVEARLHTDLNSRHPNYKFDKRIQEVRAEYLGEGNIGLPQYLILDPNDLTKPKAKKFDGSYGGVEAFKKFFKRALAKAGG
jgi:hypothetical protein